MREIKFRAWDKNKREMYYAYEVGLCDGNMDLLDFQGNIIQQNSDLEIMQFTGICDQNKNEIYEGDIVTVDGKLYYVEWRGLGDWFIDPVDNQAFVFTPEIYKLIIIGNIYDNSELLEMEKK